MAKQDTTHPREASSCRKLLREKRNRLQQVMNYKANNNVFELTSNWIKKCKVSKSPYHKTWGSLESPIHLSKKPSSSITHKEPWTSVQACVLRDALMRTMLNKETQAHRTHNLSACRRGFHDVFKCLSKFTILTTGKIRLLIENITYHLSNNITIPTRRNIIHDERKGYTLIWYYFNRLLILKSHRYF